MQCVKLRSVMGSYLNIHLNLFPIYVLLLLLTLSHGRPSAKIRETREPPKSPRQQFRENWSSPSPNSLVSVSSVVSRVRISQEQQVSTLTTPAAEHLRRATGSHTEAISSTSPSQPEFRSEKVGMDTGLQLSSVKRASEAEAAHERSKRNEKKGPQVSARVDLVDTEIEERSSNSIAEDNHVETEGLGSQSHQLGKFRQNILQSLGHYKSTENVAELSNTTLGYTHMDTLTKYNISKEEYLEAYTEYMANVKKRRLANRGLIGVKDRRRNAVTIGKTYHDNGTDLFSIGSKVLKLFRFDIQYTPTTVGTDVRILRVVLTLPAMCQLTGHLRNTTNLPDLRELSELASVDGESSWESEDMTQVDLTRNVTSWSVRSRTSSPFIVMAVCSRDSVDSHELSNVSQHRRRHASHHGSSLKVITREFLMPTPESQAKRRSRRAASNEPSTLSSFSHRRDMGRGRECANTRHGKTCCRRPLKIKFSDLGIADVILEPQEFDAHVCDGRCNARRVAYASTHAMFQHILHQTKGKKFAPRPCCVPTALSELDVLHVDPNGNRNGGPKLIVTILKDAIVKECGCS